MSFRTIGLAAFLAVDICGASHVCNLTFNDCPGKYTTATIAVPEEIIWLDPKIPFCNEPVQVTPSGPPPSIVFIIDNSGSMDENDPDAARFSVVSSLLEHIAAVAPSAEVGLVIFTRRLAFDHRENAFFKTAFPGDTTQHDSFVPLTPLNRIFTSGVNGLDTLKALLKHDDRGNLTYVTRMPASRNNSGMGRANTRDGTDISLGFQAAKLAMKDSKSDKSKQFFIFLSDGTPSTPDNGRESLINDFTTNVASTPPTFTVFFDTQHSPPVAQSPIVQMTNNIKANGYSPNNIKSAYWAINLPGSQLQDLLEVQVIGNIIFLPTSPKQATLAMGEKTYNNTALDGKGFTFPKRVPLAKQTTQVLLNYTYGYIDTIGGVQVPKEKLVPYLVTVQRASGVVLPHGLGEACEDQPDIALYDGGQPVTTVNADEGTLEARVTFPSGQSCVGCNIEVSPSSGRTKDIEDLPLAPAGGYLSSTFQREVNLTPTLGDGKLQHLPMDSIVLTWTNPENPLDMVRKSFRYADYATNLDVSRFNDLAHVPETPSHALGAQWMVAGPAGFTLHTVSPNPWQMLQGPLTAQDSLHYVGVVLEASRAFRVDINVFSNLGEFVNKFSFSLTPEEFDMLPKTGKGSTRSLRVLWDSRTSNGSLVGTGAYVFKTSLSLLNIPGIAEDVAVHNDYRVVGVLRSH